MKPDELAAERAAVLARRGNEIRQARARHLLHDVAGDTTLAVLQERMRISWPRLSAEETKATIDLAIQIATDPTRKGRRLEGAELEEAKQMATKSELKTAAAAREYVTGRLREDPKVTGMTLYGEVIQKFGYQGSQQSFYQSVFGKVRKQLKAEAAEANEVRDVAVEAPLEGAADPVTAPASEPPAGEAEAVTSSSSATSSVSVAPPVPPAPQAAPDPAAGSGGFLLLAFEAVRKSAGGTQVRVVLEHDGEGVDVVTDLMARLRGAAA